MPTKAELKLIRIIQHVNERLWSEGTPTVAQLLKGVADELDKRGKKDLVTDVGGITLEIEGGNLTFKFGTGGTIH